MDVFVVYIAAVVHLIKNNICVDTITFFSACLVSVVLSPAKRLTSLKTQVFIHRTSQTQMTSALCAKKSKKVYVAVTVARQPTGDVCDCTHRGLGLSVFV